MSSTNQIPTPVDGMPTAASQAAYQAIRLNLAKSADPLGLAQGPHQTPEEHARFLAEFMAWADQALNQFAPAFEAFLARVMLSADFKPSKLERLVSSSEPIAYLNRSPYWRRMRRIYRYGSR